MPVAQYQEDEGQANYDAGDKACRDEKKWWKSEGFLEFLFGVHLTDVLLAAFTGCLVVVGGWQGYQLRLTVSHAQIAADAAKKSADLAERTLTEHQRPWIFRDLVRVGWRGRPDPPNRVNDWDISINWKNVGRSPAMIRQFQFGITDIDLLPGEPDYSRCAPLGMVPSLAEGAEGETQAVGPVQGTKADGATIQYVFWGRLLYAEMNGKPHAGGFAIRVGTHFPAALEHNSDAYNYYT